MQVKKFQDVRRSPVILLHYKEIKMYTPFLLNKSESKEKMFESEEEKATIYVFMTGKALGTFFCNNRDLLYHPD
jgi:hypothetical protein